MRYWAERYVDDVMEHLPPCLPAREEIRRDVEAHLSEYLEAGATVEEAEEELGDPGELAERYAREVRRDLASLWDRAGAFVLDVGLGADLVLGLLVLTRHWMWGEADPTNAAFVALAGAAGLLSLLYFPVLEQRWGQTLGKRLFGVCVSRTGGTRVSFARAVVRRLPLFLEFFWLDALVAPFTEKRQRAFDLVADTVVLEAPRPVGRVTAWGAVLVVAYPVIHYVVANFPLELLPG